jgi:hypothetical protein
MIGLLLVCSSAHAEPAAEQYALKEQLHKAARGELDDNIFAEFISSDSKQFAPKVCTGDGSCGADESGTVWEAASKLDTKMFVTLRCSSPGVCSAFNVHQAPKYILFFADGGEPLTVYLDVPEFTVSFVQDLSKLKREAAIKLLEKQQQIGIQRYEALAGSGNGVVELTAGTWEEEMRKVQKGQQMLVLYYGSFRGCDGQRETLKEVAQMLNAGGAAVEKGSAPITISQVNCDINRKPCIASGFTGWCHQNLFVSVLIAD